jgi:hypothetical protein
MPRAEFEQAVRDLQAEQIHAQTAKREEESLEALRAKHTEFLLHRADVRAIAAELVRDGLSPESAARVAAASIAARGTR